MTGPNLCRVQGIFDKNLKPQGPAVKPAGAGILVGAIGAS